LEVARVPVVVPVLAAAFDGYVIAQISLRGRDAASVRSVKLPS
jgi:hypothetical protein